MLPLPPLSFGFTGGTTRADNSGGAGAPVNVGGLNFGSQSGLGTFDWKTVLILVSIGGAVYFVARKGK